MSQALQSSKCRSCGATVLWKKTEAGTFMPIDPEADAKGNLVITSQGMVRVVNRDHPARLRYRSHFVSCPHAAKHRRR